MALKDFVVKTSPNTKITISELIIRTDDETLKGQWQQIFLLSVFIKLTNGILNFIFLFVHCI